MLGLQVFKKFVVKHFHNLGKDNLNAHTADEYYVALDCLFEFDVNNSHKLLYNNCNCIFGRCLNALAKTSQSL